MLHDGFWQDELTTQSKKLDCLMREINIALSNGKLWGSQEIQEMHHKISKEIFFSAAIIRKIIEEENAFFSNAKRYNKSVWKAPEAPNLTGDDVYSLYALQVPTIKFSIKNVEDDFAVFWGDYSIEDYDLTTGKKETLLLKDISNMIIHSYIWNLGNINANNSVSGFFVSSDFDKAKSVNYVSLEIWSQLIKRCVDDAYW
ncbi:MAG: hypothetical protein J6J03_07815 [Tyzzerella sp.]|nr:hypothetical protein [Tyzzerella sp.]